MEKYNNSKFYEANNKWLINTNDVNSWNIMWQEAYNACLSRVKIFASKVPGIYDMDDLMDYAIEASLRVMNAIKKKLVRVDNLSNFVFLYCYGVFYAKKDQERNKKETTFKYEDVNEGYIYNNLEDDIIERIEQTLHQGSLY